MNTNKKIKILIIDDHDIISEGTKSRIKKILPNCECFFSTNVRSAYSILRYNEVDLILCDLEFDKEPQHDGFYIIKQILSLEPRAKLIAFTHYLSYRIMQKAKKAGFRAFLHKGTSFEDFRNTILNVIEFGSYESQAEKELKRKRISIARSIFNDSLKGIGLLSKRELEIVILSSKTTDRNTLSKLLNVEVYTVDTHFKNILNKLALSNRKEVAIFAVDFKDVLENELEKK